MASKIALVIRPTGAQGRGVSKHLLKSGWIVHALVTDPDNDRAQALKTSGVTLFKGSLSDRLSIEAAIHGANALFLTQMPSFVDDVEVREATLVLEVAKKAGVEHIVHTTTLPLNDPDVRETFSVPPYSLLAPAVLPKGEIEDLIRASGIPWTILRPGYFMINFVKPNCYFPELADGKLITAFKPDTIIPLVDPDDIGAFAVAALNDPSKFARQTISVVSERLRVEDIAVNIGLMNQKNVEVLYKSDREIEHQLDDLFIVAQLLSRNLDGIVKMDEVKQWGIETTTFWEFLQKNRASVIPSGDDIEST